MGKLADGLAAKDLVKGPPCSVPEALAGADPELVEDLRAAIAAKRPWTWISDVLASDDIGVVIAAGTLARHFAGTNGGCKCRKAGLPLYPEPAAAVGAKRPARGRAR